MASQSYFIVLAVRTCDVQNHDRLEWLLNRISSFSQSVHTMYETMTDYRQCGACSGLPQRMSIKLHIAASIIAGLIEEHYTPVDPTACFQPSQAVSQCAQVVSSICSRPLSIEVASFGSSYPQNESSSTTPGDNIAPCDPWEQEQLNKSSKCAEFVQLTCGYSKADGKPCSGLFSKEKYAELRAQVYFLTHKQMDLVILGSTMATIHKDDIPCLAQTCKDRENNDDIHAPWTPSLCMHVQLLS